MVHMPVPDERVVYHMEDLDVGARFHIQGPVVEATAISLFAREWDPLPIHVDGKIAADSIFGVLTASSSHTLAIKQKLMHQLPFVHAIICTLGFDNVRFPSPLRAGSRVKLDVICRSKRASNSNPDRGIVQFHIELSTDEGDRVLEHDDTVLMRSRGRS